MKNWYMLNDIIKKGFPPRNTTQYELALLKTNLTEEQIYALQGMYEDNQFYSILCCLASCVLGILVYMTVTLFTYLW